MDAYYCLPQNKTSHAKSIGRHGLGAAGEDGRLEAAQDRCTHLTLPFRLLYILPGGRVERLQQGQGNFPDEFFYGYCQLARRQGWQGELMTRASTSRAGIWLQQATHWFTNLSPDFGNAAKLNSSLLKRYDAIVSMSEPVLFMLALRKRRLQDANLVLILIGADKRVERSPFPFVTKQMLRWLFKRLAAIVVIGEGERDYLLGRELIPAERVHLVQFGVDASFWTPVSRTTTGDYILSMGNDDGRDYETLLQAIGPRPLRLHTARKLPPGTLPPNVIYTTGDWKGQALSDSAVRDLYRGSHFVVTPLKESAQPQGQSVTLQAMACGKAVILSETRGLWSRTLMRHMENCYLVPAGDVPALRKAIDLMAADPALCARLGKSARASVEEHFSSNLMAERIAAILLNMPRNRQAP